MPSTPAEVAAKLTAEEQRRLAAEPDLLARFNELTATALSEGPKSNPFWLRNSADADLRHGAIFKHAAYTVDLDRSRAARLVAA